jgi:hypothetical protein
MMSYQESNGQDGGYQTDTPSNRMDPEVLASLYDALERQPSSVYIHERLFEVWNELGDEGNEALLYCMSSG